MKYKIHSLIVLMLVIGLSGCLKDRSNYLYGDKEVITVEGIKSSYTVVSQVDKLQLSPVAKSTEPNAEFEYLWGIYETAVQGSIPVLDTISRTKDLDYLITQPAKGWVLVYRVTNKKTGYAAYFTSSINVVTAFTRGWYVAKDDGANTDMDLFFTENSIVPTGINENVYSKVNGAPLPGKANFLSFFHSYKSKVTGSLGNTRALFLTSDKDVAVMNINTLLNIRTLDNILFSAPQVREPAQFFNGSSAYYFFNGGQLHTIYNMSANDGRFGARVMVNANNSPYHLSKYFLTTWINDPFFFDEISGSFLSMSMGYGQFMASTSDASGTEMSANNNSNLSLLYLGTKNFVTAQYITGIAIFQDKIDPSIKILSTITAPTNRKLTILNDTLSSSEKLYNATDYTVLNGDENLLYFAVGNEIWSRNLSNGFENLEYTIPAGEELTYLRHKKYASEANYAFNFIIIGTKSGSNYKIRMFEKSSGSITGEPKVVMEGKGIVRDVYYISPSVTESTNNLTY